MRIIKLTTLFFILSASFGLLASSRKLERSFKTDICTAWPNGIGQYDWSHCCIEHDLYLWAGGLKEHSKLANKRLRTCVEDASTKFYADIMYFGIVVGGLSPIKLPDKKWGNAWGESDTGEKLSLEEIEVIEDEVFATEIDLPITTIDEFLSNLKKLNLE